MTEAAASIPEPAIARLAALRRELDKRNLDGFIVPSADEHQGEYVADRARRLQWITGFTGSAGIAVILADKAAIFVDGRYTLQAGHEVDSALFEVLHVTDQPLSRWISENLGTGAKLGFDPWLHVADQVRSLRAVAEAAEASLVPVPENPIDAVWADQPAQPLSPVVLHGLDFAGRSAWEKRGDIAQALVKDRIDAAVLSDPASIAWLLNIRGNDVPFTPLSLAFAIIRADASVQWFIDRRKLTPEIETELGPGVTLARPEQLGEAFDALGKAKARVRFDPSHGPFAILDRLEAAGATVQPGADPCTLPKACKNPTELAGTSEAHRRDGAALVSFLAWLATEAPKGDVDELTAASRLESYRRHGKHFRGLSFPTIAGAGPNGAVVHYRSTEATNRRLAPSELFLLDSGAQYLDGTTDVTRTVHIGPHPPEADQRRCFTLVLKGHIALASQVFPAGTSGSQLDVLARQFLWKAGLDFDHGTGHGVGSFLSVHEGPQRISKVGNQVALQPGMILSVEPGYYRAGAWGIRLENLVAVAEAPAPEGAERNLLRFEPLTLAPFDRALVDGALLTPEESAWLDSYHARVAAEIGPLVDDATRGWLDETTRPIGMC